MADIVKTFKLLILVNGPTEFDQTWSEASLHLPVSDLFKQFRPDAEVGHNG